jgi:hypothetical protein
MLNLISLFALAAIVGAVIFKNRLTSAQTSRTIAYKVWLSYPALQAPSLILLSIKSLLIIALLSGNYLGGNLVYRYHIGIYKEL